MYKKILTIVLLMGAIPSVIAQTQQGYVKTRGRLSKDGVTVIPGNPLGNVVVTIESLSPVKSGHNGLFSFALPASTIRYRVEKVELKDYVLSDPDALMMQHTYSKDQPLVVVLENKAQREQDLENARNSVRKVMKENVRKKEDEIDSLERINAITRAECDSLRREFLLYRQSSEHLVNEMAERFVSIDYDRLDDFNRQVQIFIETGQLTKADSMIRSKGSLEERYNRVKKYESVNLLRDKEIRQQQETLDRSLRFTQKEKEDLSNDLYRQYLIFLQQPLRQDSALFCLKMRADLDTTNFNAVYEYAELSHDQKRFEEAESYYYICFRVVSNQSDLHRLSQIQNELGCLYQHLHDYDKSEQYHNLALLNREILYRQNPERYCEDFSASLHNLGFIYDDLRDYYNSERYYLMALELRERLFRNNPDEYCEQLAETQANIGRMYMRKGDYSKSCHYCQLALDNFLTLYAKDSIKYCYNLAMLYNNRGLLYYDIHDYSQSEKDYKSALALWEKLFSDNPEAYRLDISFTQQNLGSLYRVLSQNIQSERFYMLALENKEKLFSVYPDAYRSTLAGTQNSIGLFYLTQNDYEKSEKYLNLALKNREKLFEDYPETYREALASTQDNLGILYFHNHDYASSELYIKLALENRKKLYESDSNGHRFNLAVCYGQLMGIYEQTENWNMYDTCISKALELYEALFSSDSVGFRPYLNEVQAKTVLRMVEKGSIDEANRFVRDNLMGFESAMNYLLKYLITRAYSNTEKKDYVKSENCYLFILDVISVNPERYLPYIAETQYLLGDLYNEIYDTTNSIKYYIKSSENYKVLYFANPMRYGEDLANVYWNIMLLYANMGQAELYDTCLSNTLSLYRTLYKSNPSKYKKSVINLQNRVVARLWNKGSIDEAIEIARDNLSIDSTNQTSLNYLAWCMNSKAYLFVKDSDFTAAISTIEEAIMLSPQDAAFYDTKGEILMIQGKDQEALLMWQKVLELNPKFLDEYPEGTNLSNGLKERGLIK